LKVHPSFKCVIGLPENNITSCPLFAGGTVSDRHVGKVSP
jgi:hypothetical protein